MNAKREKGRQKLPETDIHFKNLFETSEDQKKKGKRKKRILPDGPKGPKMWTTIPLVQ